jgi:hypothetical protein
MLLIAIFGPDTLQALGRHDVISRVGCHHDPDIYKSAFVNFFLALARLKFNAAKIRASISRSAL